MAAEQVSLKAELGAGKEAFENRARKKRKQKKIISACSVSAVNLAEVYGEGP